MKTKNEKTDSGESFDSSGSYPTFVNVDGDWVNPLHIVSVIHHDAVKRTNDMRPQKVVVTLTSGDKISLPEWTARDACVLVDKFEGRKVG